MSLKRKVDPSEMDLSNEGSPTKKQRMVPAEQEAEGEAANYVQYFPEINFVGLDKSDPVSGLFPNEIIELLVTFMPYRTQCVCQVASRSLQTLIKAVQRSHSKWPEFMAAVQKKAPQEYDDVFTKLSKFDEIARVVDRSNNYYWYQKCPICMKSKEMDIIKETETAMKMKCSLCEERYGCAIVWTYSFNTIACADCGGKRPKGFTCFNCKNTYCQECKFYDRALNAYGCAENVCTRCVRQCGHACDWGYVVGTAETCSDCNKKLCGRCAHYGSDCLDGSDEENDEDEEEEDGEEEEDIEDEDNESEDEKDQPKDESEHDDKEYVSLTAEVAAKLAQVEENLKKWKKYF